MKKIGEKGFEKTNFIYLLIMSIYELADKLYGSVHIVFMRVMGLSLVQISRIVSIGEILLAIFDFPTGTIADRIGRKKIAGYGFITAGIALLIYANSTGFWSFLLANCIWVFAVALMSGAPQAWLVDKMISEGVYDKRTQILPRIMGVLRIFSIVASVISFCIVQIDIKLPLIAAGIFAIIAGVVALCVGEDNYGKLKSDNLFKNLADLSKSFFKDKKLIILAIRRIAKYIPFVCFVLYWQIQATEVVFIDKKYMTFILALYMVCIMIGSFSASYFMKKCSGFRASIIGIIIYIAGFIVLLVNKDIIFFIIGSSMIEYGFGIEQAASETWTCEFVKSEVRSSYSSIFSTINAIFGFFFINILGMLTEKVGIYSVWIIAIIVACTDIMLLVMISKKCKKRLEFE